MESLLLQSLRSFLTLTPGEMGKSLIQTETPPGICNILMAAALGIKKCV